MTGIEIKKPSPARRHDGSGASPTIESDTLG
jgi:hypothetical protein